LGPAGGAASCGFRAVVGFGLLHIHKSPSVDIWNHEAALRRALVYA
jgi:hypothetical protein